MDIKKILYSKCPNCKRHGIFVLKAHRTFNPVMKCEYCEKKYRMNRFNGFLYRLIAIVFPLLVGKLVDTYIVELPIWIPISVGIILYVLCQYFTPVRRNFRLSLIFHNFSRPYGRLTSFNTS